jgi:hypothetical protein
MHNYSKTDGQDFILIKADSAGDMLWKPTYGGTGLENAYAVIQTSDGGYVLTGNTNSFGAGGYDVWLVKTDEAGVVPEGLTVEVMVLLSTVAVIFATRHYRKRTRWEKSVIGKP